MNVDTAKELTHLSLCAGYGGIDLGLQRTFRAIRTVCFVEIEAYAIENLAKKIEAGHLDCAPIWSDLKTFPWQLFSERVDILSGGFPCQPFSHAGRRGGDSDPRHLWPYILRGIKQLGRPPLVFLENVAGILSAKLKGSQWSDPEGTPVLLHVLRELERVGYKAEAGIFSAVEVGAPHQRKRVFILAIRADLKPSGYELISGELRSDEPSTIYPAGRGSEQYGWEPSRVILENPDSKPKRPGAESKDKNRRCVGRGWKSISYRRQLQINDARFAGLCSNECSSKKGMVNTDSRGEESRIEQHRLLQIKTREKQADRPARRGDFITDAAEHIQGPIKSKVGGGINGAAHRVGDEQLYRAFDNRTDELRLLGNGVVPDTAARAFRVLFNRLASTQAVR